jgi:acetylornithine deacetylase
MRAGPWNPFRRYCVPGIPSHPSWLEGRRYPEGRNDVVAVWKGKGGGRSLLFSGHADVGHSSRVIGKKTKPFSPFVENGRLYGRDPRT